MKRILFTILACFLLTTEMSRATPSAAIEPVPDSLLTEDYIYEFTFSNFGKAVRIIELIRERELLAKHRIDIAEGDLYFNTGRYRRGLVYYRRALESDAVQNDDTEYMEQLHRMISSYDCLHEEKQKAYYVELLLLKAKTCGNLEMESVALFNMGKMLYYQEDKERGYRLVNESIELMKQSDYKYKYDNLRYNYNTLLIMQQRDKRYVDALKTLDLLNTVVTEDSQNALSIGGLAEKEKKTMYAQRAVILSRLGRVTEANEAYKQWCSTGNVYDKDNYLIIPYLMDRKRYDEVIRIYTPREQFLRDQKDTINYHMITVKRSLGRAYGKKGNYEKAANYFEELALLTDSLKVREQQSAAIELATVYETNEKEARLKEQAVHLKVRNTLLLSAVGAILLLSILLWWNIKHMRTIWRKNKAMVTTIEELFSYKDELHESKQEIRILKQEILKIEQQKDILLPEEKSTHNTATGSGKVKNFTENGISNPSVFTEANEENQILFEKLEAILVSDKLFLNPDLSREDLMKLLHIGKNRFGQIIQQYTGTNITTYINTKRLEYAARLLKIHTNYKVTSIAEMCGIPNIQTFHRLFRNKFGMTPIEFRKSIKNADNKTNTTTGGQSETTL